MLVLTRKLGDEVLIRTPDGEIIGKVTVIQIKGKQVRLGFSFNKSYLIDRADYIPQELRAKLDIDLENARTRRADKPRRREGEGSNA